MHRVRHAAQVALLLLLATLALAAQTAKHRKKPTDDNRLGEAIDQILSDPDVARGFWGIDVVALDTGQHLFGLNENRLFTPASNTKLFTTAAAFGLIGPEFRFKTTVESMGSIDKYGRLNSDLVVVGRGDPNLSGRTLPYYLHTERKSPPIQALIDLADQLVQKGLKYVDGDVVADDSYYVFERYGEGWSQDDLAWEWGAPVSALTINDNVLFVNILPADRPGEKAFLNITPFPEYYRIDNRVTTTPQGTGPRKVFINREPGSNQVTIWGNIPVDDTGEGEMLAIEDPAEFSAKLFSNLLEQRGVTIYGRPRTRHTELASMQTFSVTTIASGGGSENSAHAVPTPMVLASHESMPLYDDLRVVNKVSQNLHAELALRMLGKEKGTSGSIQGGLEVLHGFLTSAGIQSDQFVFYDGSGLSRENLVSPAAVVRLLQYAKLQPWGPLFEDTLPVSGVDGSLGDRLKTPPYKGLRARQDRLAQSRQFAFGVCHDNDRPNVAFSILWQQPQSARTREQSIPSTRSSRKL